MNKDFGFNSNNIKFGLFVNLITQEDIKDALEKACNILPSKSFVVECNALVETYIDQIIEEIESGLSPKNICGSSGLDLCTSSLEMSQVQVNRTPLRNYSNIMLYVLHQ